MHRTKSSAGFSLDIPLIMLTASILKLFYYPGARYDAALLAQAALMILVQLVVLKVALDTRPSWRDGAAVRGLTWTAKTRNDGGSGSGWMPGGFWRWRAQAPYWQFLGLLTAGLLALHVLLAPSSSRARPYTAVLGALGLTIEATLALPQLWSNYCSRSTRGFRVSVLANWLLGDAMKMSFFFLQGGGKVPWAFKACGVFQAVCDVGLGLQWWIYGSGDEEGVELEKRVQV